MEQPKIIKKVEPVECPHCKQVFYIGTQAMLASIVSISTNEDVKKAKDEIKEKMKQIKFKDEKERDGIFKWLDDENNLLDRSDIEPLLKQIAVEQITKIQANGKKTEVKNKS